MKKKKICSYILFTLILVGALFPVCVGAKPRLSKKTVTIKVGQSVKIKVKGTTAKIKWSSSNKKIAVVKKGKITGKKAGKATIKAKVKNITLKCKVTVKKKKKQADNVKVAENIDDFSKAAAKMLKENKKKNGFSVQAEDEFYSCRLIVKTNGETIDLSSVNPKQVLNGPDNVYFVQFESSSAAKKAWGVISDWNNIVYVEPDSCQANTDTSSSGADGNLSWGVSKLGADKLSAYANQKSNSSIVVGVIDTGVSNHTFLNGRILSGGFDFVDNDSKPSDLNGHGTHVAGTIVDCSRKTNVKILPIRVLDEQGAGYTTSVGLGVLYAAAHGAKVINLSLGGEKSLYLDDCVKKAVKKGVTVVVAAGNEYGNTANGSPSHLSEVICVGAVDSNLNRAPFSNAGSALDVVAPGVGITSCIPGGRYATYNGTSMATPHISAIAAMIKLINPSFTPADNEQLVKKYCKDLGASGRDNYYGCGFPDFSSYRVPEDSDGKWSDWSTQKPDSSKTIQTKTQYRYCDRSTTQSTSSTMSGWTLYDTKTSYGSWGSWSNWSGTSQSSSDSKQVETRTEWRYYAFVCPVCGGREPFQGTSDCHQYSLSGSNWQEKWFPISYKNSNSKTYSYTTAKRYTESLGDGLRWNFTAGNLNDTAPGTQDYGYTGTVIRTGYRYRTRSLTKMYYFYKWGNWSSWQDAGVSSGTNRKIETRTLYRYRIN